VTPREFFSHLVWIDGRPLLATMEEYRLKIFDAAFAQTRRFNTVLTGRAKKNWKTSDLVLAALYALLVPESPQGNGCFIIANDEDQANDDLSLAKKIVAANPLLSDEVNVLAKEIVRRDGRGSLRILPAGDAIGLHGKTYLFLGIDEMHGYRDYLVLEALAGDPTRPDSLMWVTSYASVFNSPGAPLFDYYQRGVRGADARMLFSWYSADHCTDPDFAELPPEQRANPSMASWGNDEYLAEQRIRLPAHKFRRLHLNLPGMPDGGVFDPTIVIDSIPENIRQRERLLEINGGPVSYRAFADHNLGGADTATIAIAHYDIRTNHVVLDALIARQGTAYDLADEVTRRFVPLCKAYGVFDVWGDSVGGPDSRNAYAAGGVSYTLASEAGLPSKHELYSEFAPLLNAGRVELLDITELREQLLGLVYRGQKIDHLSGEHDDFINSGAGALVRASRDASGSIRPENLYLVPAEDRSPMFIGSGHRSDLNATEHQLAERGLITI